jgi:hypothetical protein
MDLADLERRVRALEDIEAIKQLKYRYADACDRGYDANALADLFTEDAVWDGGLFGRYEGTGGDPPILRGCLVRHRLRHALHVEPDHHRRGRRGPGKLVSLPDLHLRRREPVWAPLVTRRSTSALTGPGSFAT